LCFYQPLGEGFICVLPPLYSMKTKETICSRCNEETLHDIGKKQATNRSGSYTRRTTSRCRMCGTKEITNRKTGKRIIKGYNQNESEETKSNGGK